jgi:iron complex transport system permease protein
VGGIVAVTGPIGFVGMMIPHMARRIVGANHRILAPVCILFGGSFLVLCDTVARVLLSGIEIPVGVITALLGGPFFLWLLLSKKF